MTSITIDLGAAGVGRLSTPDGKLTLEVFGVEGQRVVISQAYALDRLAASITAARAAGKLRAVAQPGDAA
jgi:hypothetical protein